MSAPGTEQTPDIVDFSLPASTGQTLRLDSFKGKVPLVIVFIADVASDEDRALLTELDRRHKDFGAERSQLLVVVRSTARETRQRAEEMGLTVPLLADASGAMARDYGAEDEDGSHRIAVVADKHGRLRRRFDSLPLEGDPGSTSETLLSSVKGLGTGTLG
ncbi:MAG: peroxiredoxin family protein [Acidimicrobiia bacterium]